MLLLIPVRAWTKQEGPLKQITLLWYEERHMLHSERMLSVLVLQEMNNELKRQERVLDAVTDHTDRSAYELQNVSQQAKKDFKVRPGAYKAFKNHTKDTLNLKL